MDADLDRAFALHAEGRTGEAVTLLRAVVAQTPCDITLTRFLVEQYEYLTRDLPTVGQEGRR